jgi:putative ABC transport system permease protein
VIKAALKSLLGRKLRLVMSTFAIVLGVAFVAGTLIFTDTLNRSFTALFASTVGDVVVRPGNGPPEDGAPSSEATVPAALVDRLAQLPGASRADGNVTAFGVYVVGDDGKVVGTFGPPALGANWTTAPAGHGLEGLSIVKGDEPHGRDEVVLDASTAERAGYAVGDQVPLLTAGATARLDPTLVGIADFRKGGSLNGATLAIFDTATSQQLFLDGQDAFTDVWVTADEGVSQDELRDQVAEVLPDDFEAVTGDKAADEVASELMQGIGFLKTFLLIFAGIALVVGAFLIVNTFSILVAQRSRELALLRALGASRRQVTGSVLLEASAVGLFGSTAGLGLGVLLALGIRELFGGLGLDLSGQPMVFEARTVLVAYVVGLVVTVTAAWLPARRTARISPVQAMRDDVALPESSLRRRFWLGVALVVVGLGALGVGLFSPLPYGPQETGAGVFLILLGVTAASPIISRPLLVAVHRLYARLFGPIGNLAGQNALRNPRRTAATASALMIGLTLACTMAIVGASAKASVDQAVEENFVGDYVVSNTLGGPMSPTIGDRIQRVPGVESVVRQRFQYTTIDGDGEGLSATDPATVDRLGIDVVSGSPDDLADGTVLVRDSWAEDEGYAVGDSLEIEGPSGKRSLRIVGLYDDNPIVALPVLTTLQTMEDLGYQPQDSTLVIYTDDSSGVRERLDHEVEDLPIVTVKDQAAFAEEQRAPIDQFVLIIYALLGLALLIAVLGIVNTLALSVIERTREVGLLRAIGVSRRQLRRMITLESVVISVLGTILGVVLGTGFGIALMRAVRDEGLHVIAVPYGQVALFLVLSVLVGVLAAVFPARRAARLDVLRAIATE